MSDINLLDSFREEKKQKRKRALGWIIPIAMVLLVMFFLVVMATKSIDQMKSKMALVSIDQERLDEAQHLESQIGQLEKSKRVLKSIADTNGSINQNALFDYFSKILPEELYIYKYTLDNKSICTMYGYTKYEKYLGELSTNLENNKAFKNIQINYKKNIISDKKQSEIEAFSFQLTFYIDDIELNKDVKRLKTDFSNKSSQEDIINLLEKNKKENDTLMMTYKLGGAQINTINEYLEGPLDDDLKGYVIEHNVTLDMKGEFSKLSDFLYKLYEDASIRINNISMHTNKESGLTNCTMDMTCVGVVSFNF